MTRGLQADVSRGWNLEKDSKEASGSSEILIVPGESNKLPSTLLLEPLDPIPEAVQKSGPATPWKTKLTTQDGDNTNELTGKHTKLT